MPQAAFGDPIVIDSPIRQGRAESSLTAHSLKIDPGKAAEVIVKRTYEAG